MTKCQHCGKELSEAEVKSNYCFGCGNPAGIQASKPKPEPEPKPLPEEPELKELTDESIRCPHCNFLNPKDTKFCNECGAPLAEKEPKTSEDIEKRKCPNCGKEVKEHWKTCPWCGKSLIMEETKKEAAEEINRCPSCGKEVETDWLSCPYCGKPLIKKKKEEEKIVNAKLIFPDKSEKEIIGDELIIGREDFEECLRGSIITKDQFSCISRRLKPQFKIVRRNNEFYIIDDSSANWTLVNDTKIGKNEPIQEVKLNDGDIIIPVGETKEDSKPKMIFKIINKKKE